MKKRGTISLKTNYLKNENFYAANFLDLENRRFEKASFSQ